jgi:hypothetical protein
VYRVLADWGSPGPTAPRLAAAHFWLSLASVLGVWINGIFGYRLINRISPGFYYKPDTERLNLWLSIDGWCLSLFGIGAVFFLVVVFGSLKHGTGEVRS